MIKISIITINYNNGAGLAKTMDSVIEQTYKNIEYIVVDGDSTDGSKNVILERAEKIAAWLSEKDDGIYDAMNKGILKSTGDYLLFLNSGDTLWNRDVIGKVSAHLGNEDIVYGNLKINDRGNISEGFMPDKITLSQMMLDTLWHPVSFIRRELFTKYGLYNTSYKICGDYDFFFKVIIANKVSQKHIKEFISVFGLEGLSSDEKNVQLIKSEKEKIQASYLSQQQIEEFWTEHNKSKKNGFFKRWFR